MAARREVTLVVSARDRTRAVFRRITGGLRRLRLSLAGIASAVAGGALVRGLLGAANDIDAAAQRLDVSRETLGALRLQAQRAGVSFDQVVDVMQELATAAGEATDPLDRDFTKLDAFRRLGISLQELEGLNTEDLLFAVADASADTSRSWKETSALLEKIAGQAVDLRGLLVQGGDNLARGANALVDAGRVLSPEQIREAAERQRQAAETYAEVQARLADVLERLIPVLDRGLSVAEVVLRENERVRTGVLDAGTAATEIVAGRTRTAASAAATIGIELGEQLRPLIVAAQETAKNTANSNRLR